MQEVSVIIPNYNGMAYSGRCAFQPGTAGLSRISKTILVDNGSADGSCCLCNGELSLGAYRGAAG